MSGIQNGLEDSRDDWPTAELPASEPVDVVATLEELTGSVEAQSKYSRGVAVLVERLSERVEHNQQRCGKLERVPDFSALHGARLDALEAKPATPPAGVLYRERTSKKVVGFHCGESVDHSGASYYTTSDPDECVQCLDAALEPVPEVEPFEPASPFSYTAQHTNAARAEGYTEGFGKGRYVERISSQRLSFAALLASFVLGGGTFWLGCLLGAM